MLDWVPCQNYDRDVPIPAVSQTEFGLLNLASWNAPAEVIGDIEGEDDNYRILRIVGYWTVHAIQPQPSAGAVYVRLWPGFQDQQSASLVTPGILTAGAIATVDEVGLAANEKWWWERIMTASDVGPVTEPWSNLAGGRQPFNYMLDIKPSMSMTGSFVPTVSIQNNTDEDLEFRHRWRMLVRKK